MKLGFFKGLANYFILLTDDINISKGVRVLSDLISRLSTKEIWAGNFYCVIISNRKRG